MKTLNNELSGYEAVAVPRGVCFVKFLRPSPPPPWPTACYILRKVRRSAGSAANNSEAEEHLKKKSERKDGNYCPAPLPAHAYQR